MEKIYQALTSDEVLDSLTYLVKNGPSKDLFSSFIFHWSGRYRIVLDHDVIRVKNNGDVDKKKFAGVILCSKESNDTIYNGTIINIDTRFLNDVSRDDLIAISNEEKSFLCDLSDIDRIHITEHHSINKGYCAYVSDNVNKIEAIIDLLNTKYQFVDKSIVDEMTFNSARVYILLVESSFLGKDDIVDNSLKYRLYVKAVDL